MTCPECATDNRDSAERCSTCGHVLALPVGTVLADRYEIKCLLGVGGLGRVYRAHDRMLDELVAVKVLHPEAARSAELSKRFRSEIKLARKVRHKNVCAIHEYGEHEGYRFVAMELVDGVDLHRVLRERGPLPPKEAFDVCIQVTKGLAAIHGAGVIHRDLKSPNIMRDAQGDVRLLDFGIAKLITPTGTLAVTAVQKVVGTPEYMSPEQIRGDDLDERSDIYGLGVVIYELFTGVVPFQGKSPLDTLVKHMNMPPPLYGDAAARLVPSLVPVLRRCLAKTPRERFSSARELLDALRVARNTAFPEATVTPQGMMAVEQEPAAPLKTSVLPRTPPPGPTTPPPLPPARVTPRPVSLPAPPPVSPPARSPTTPRPVALPTPAPAAAQAPLPAPPVGPPRHPLPGAPPQRLARELAVDAALDRGETYVELPQHPAAPESPPLPPPRARTRGGAWGVGLALLGLGAATGAWLWQRYRPVDRPSPPPTTVVAATPLPSPPPTTLPAPTPAPTAPPSPPAPAPTETPMESVSTTPNLQATPRRRKPSPTPTATPTPEPTPTPLPTTGTLELEVKPSATVEVDGRDAGKAPLASLELDAGTHVLKLTHPDYWPVTRRVSVESGKALRLDVDLSWEGLPRARSKDAPFSEPIDGSPSDTDLERGLHQLAEGDFQEAILTLEPVARRLEQAGKEKELARAEFYLGIALLELNRQGSAKERFAKALEHDSSLRVPGAAFSPKITTFFGTVREAAKKKP